MVESDTKPAIREALEGDARTIADLWTEAYVTHGVGGRSRPYVQSDFLASAGHGRVFVADRESGPAGSRIVGVVVLLDPGSSGRVVSESGEAELARLAVARPARRAGIGRALAVFCSERARAAGWVAIALWSRPGQVEAHRLYESLGYRRIPERDSVDATGQARLVFRLAL